MAQRNERTADSKQANNTRAPRRHRLILTPTSLPGGLLPRKIPGGWAAFANVALSAAFCSSSRLGASDPFLLLLGLCCALLVLTIRGLSLLARTGDRGKGEDREPAEGKNAEHGAHSSIYEEGNGPAAAAAAAAAGGG